jgi:hypothetical protein
MKGCVPTNHIDQFKARLKEGSVYTLETFIVADVRNKYRVADHSYRIKITQVLKSSGNHSTT